MREVIALAVTILSTTATTYYCYLTIKKKISPVLSSWLLFSVATSMSLTTYIFSKEHDAIRNIGNAIDVAAALAITSVVGLSNRSKNALSFTRLETACLLATAAILVFWGSSRNETVSNLAVQGILIAGYLPLVTHLWKARENTESTFIWTVFLLNSSLALYLPIKEKDLLATVYNLRAVISVALVVGLILRIKFRKRKRGF